MEAHHARSIDNLIAEFEKDESVLALILGGSIAHGFARPDSDIDVAIVVDSSDYQRRVQSGLMHYNNRTLCTYERGYIDGKYIDVEFLRAVAERGSEPARFAFKDGRILFSRISGLEELLQAVVRYPAEDKRQRIDRFIAQLLAWRWYYTEAVRKNSQYLTYLALQKLVLFGSRIVLAQNELLYPYHKWLLRVLGSAPNKPPELLAHIDQLLGAHSWEVVESYCQSLLAFVGVTFQEADRIWPTRFMKDTELSWQSGHTPIDDL